MMNEEDFMMLAETFIDRPGIICLFLFLFTFVLEDVATVSAALLTSYDYIPWQGAYLSLLAGIVIGDLGLYGLGYAASHFKWAQNLLERKKVMLANSWLSTREVPAIVGARFIPGARLPTYAAMGFFRLSFVKFVVTVLFASVVWTSVLFSIILLLGDVFVDQLEVWRIPFAIFMIVFIIVAPRFCVLCRKKEKV